MMNKYKSLWSLGENSGKIYLSIFCAKLTSGINKPLFLYVKNFLCKKYLSHCFSVPNLFFVSNLKIYKFVA